MKIGPVRIPYAALLIGPAILFALGFLSNAIAIAANGGYMSVEGAIECVLHSSAGTDDIIHACMTPATHLKILSDWIYYYGAQASPGDFMEWAGDKSMWPCIFIWLGFVIRDYSEDSDW